MNVTDNAGPTGALYLLHTNGVPLTADGKVLHLELGIGDGETRVYMQTTVRP